MKPLNARAVEGLKPQPGKRPELADHVVRGLSLRVSAAGVKTWALRYRNPTGGFPALSLERARAMALVALGQVADQRDPAREKSTSGCDRKPFADNCKGEGERKPPRTSAPYHAKARNPSATPITGA